MVRSFGSSKNILREKVGYLYFVQFWEMKPNWIVTLYELATWPFNFQNLHSRSINQRLIFRKHKKLLKMFLNICITVSVLITLNIPSWPFDIKGLKRKLNILSIKSYPWPLWCHLFFFKFSFTSLLRLSQLIWDGPINRWGENERTRRKTTWHTKKFKRN